MIVWKFAENVLARTPPEKTQYFPKWKQLL